MRDLLDRRRELPGLLAVLVFLLVGFDLLNSLAPMRTASAVAHGRSVLAAESSLHLSFEASASGWLASHHLLALTANWAYNLCQALVTPVVLAGVWWLHPLAWSRLRWVIVGTNVLALLVFWTWPVAPPRLVPGSGVRDTIASVPIPFGWPAGIRPGDPGQFQALPSLHIAWATWVGAAVLASTRRRWSRRVAVAYPVVIALVVIGTGTHSLVDVVAGAAATVVLCLALGIRPARAGSVHLARGAIATWNSASSPSRTRAPRTTIS